MKYLPKLNMSAVRKLEKNFKHDAIECIQEAINGVWDEELHGNFDHDFVVIVPADALLNKCLYTTNDILLNSLSSVAFTFNTAKDMERVDLKKPVIGEWIKASEIDKYDIWSLGNVDILLRNSQRFTDLCDHITEVTNNHKLYKLGYLNVILNKVIIPVSDETLSLSLGKWDIMIIKAK